MVLEDSTSEDPSTSSSSLPSPPPSDTIPPFELYFEGRRIPDGGLAYHPGRLPFSIDPATLATVPAVNRLFRHYDVQHTVTNTLQRHTIDVGRMLRGDEERAIAEHTSRAVRFHSFAGPSVLGWALWRAYATRGSLKFFPFGDMARDKPRPFFPYWDGQTIRMRGGRIDLLKYVSAGAKWPVMQALRLMTFSVFGYAIFPAPSIKILATVALLRAEAKDERLTAFWEEVKTREPVEVDPKMKGRTSEGIVVGTQSSRGKGGMGGLGGSPGGPPPPSPPLPQDIRAQLEDIRAQLGGSAQGQGVDDASPSGGQGTFDLDSLYGDQGPSDNSSKEMRQRGQQMPGSAAQSRLNQPPRWGRPEKAQKSSQDDDTYGGDSETKDQKDSGGDTWARIRSAAMEGESSSPASSSAEGPQDQQGDITRRRPSRRRDRRRERREASRQADAPNEYEISKRDEEQSYARSQAQKEFDDRVERERAGGDFDGGGKKW